MDLKNRRRQNLGIAKKGGSDLCQDFFIRFDIVCKVHPLTETHLMTFHLLLERLSPLSPFKGTSPRSTCPTLWPSTASLVSCPQRRSGGCPLTTATSSLTGTQATSTPSLCRQKSAKNLEPFFNQYVILTLNACCFSDVAVGQNWAPDLMNKCVLQINSSRFAFLPIE